MVVRLKTACSFSLINQVLVSLVEGLINLFYTNLFLIIILLGSLLLLVPLILLQFSWQMIPSVYDNLICFQLMWIIVPVVGKKRHFCCCWVKTLVPLSTYPPISRFLCVLKTKKNSEFSYSTIDFLFSSHFLRHTHLSLSVYVCA